MARPDMTYGCPGCRIYWDLSYGCGFCPNCGYELVLCNAKDEPQAKHVRRNPEFSEATLEASFQKAWGNRA